MKQPLKHQHLLLWPLLAFLLCMPLLGMAQTVPTLADVKPVKAPSPAEMIAKAPVKTVEKDGFTWGVYDFTYFGEPYTRVAMALSVPAQDTVRIPTGVELNDSIFPVAGFYCNTAVKHYYFSFYFYNYETSFGWSPVYPYDPDKAKGATFHVPKYILYDISEIYEDVNVVCNEHPSEHPGLSLRNYYDVDGDGRMEVIGRGRHDYVVTDLDGNLIKNVPSGFYQFATLDNSGEPFISATTGYAKYSNEGSIVLENATDYLGDLNNDGLKDVFEGPYNDTFTAYIQQRDGTFLEQTMFVTEDTTELTTKALSNYRPSSASTGGSDWFVKAKEHSGFDFEEDEASGAKALKSYELGTKDNSCYVSDVNGDGLMDIVTSTYLYYNLGNYRFYRSAYAGTLYNEDLNGDGLLDYVGVSESGKVSLYITNNDGSMGAEQSLFENTSLSKVFFGDFDKDGDVDILFYILDESDNATYLVYYRNEGNGKFKKKESYLEAAYTAADCKDYDGDGFYEIAAESMSKNSSGGYDFVLIKCNLKTLDTTVTNVLTPDTFDDDYIILGDVNNDGIVEVGASRYIYFPYNGSYVYWPEDYGWGYQYTGVPNATVNTRPAKMSAPAARLMADQGNVNISWTKGSDVETSACDLTYNLRVGTAPGKGDVLFAESGADGHRLSLMEPNMGKHLNYSLNTSRLDAGTYYIAVQAIDAGGLGGPWSDELVYEHKQTLPVIALPTTNIISGDTVRLNVVTPRSSATYTWRVDNATLIEQSANGDVAYFVFNRAGLQNIGLQMTSDGKTYDAEKVQVEVQPIDLTAYWSGVIIRGTVDAIFDANQDGIAEVYDGGDDVLYNYDADGNATKVKKSYNTDLSGSFVPYDFNKDGYPDFMLSRSEKNVYINSGEQDLEFEYSTNANWKDSYKAIIDFQNTGNYLGWRNRYGYLMDSTNTTHAVADYIADFNRDGWFDWCVNAENSLIRIADGMGSYEQKAFSAFSQDGYTLKGFADFNSDGYPDGIYEKNQRPYYYVIVKGKPKSEWPCDEIVFKTPEGTNDFYVLPDIDNNGYPDIYVSTDPHVYNLYLMQENFGYTKLATPKYNCYDELSELVWQPLTPGAYPNGFKTAIKNEAPSAPTNVTATQTSNGLLLKWEDAKDDHTPWAQMRYNVSVKRKGKTGEGAFVISPLNGLSDDATICSNVIYRRATQMLIPNSALTAGETYEVQVQAIDLMGDHSPMSKVTEVTVSNDGYLTTSCVRAYVGVPVNVNFVGTLSAQHSMSATDAEVSLKSDGSYNLRFSSSGKKTATFVNGDKTFTLDIVVYDEELSVALPEKVFKNTPIVLPVPAEFNRSYPIKKGFVTYNGNKASYEEGDSTVTLTFHSSGGQQVKAYIWLADETVVSAASITQVLTEEMPQAALTGVTSDGSNYRLNWNTTAPSLVDRVEISRETTRANQFEVLDTLSLSAGTWIDASSNNVVQSQRYRIRLLASNGQASGYSAVHKPMHVMLGKAADGSSYNLMWNAYEGLDVESYTIWRGTTENNLSAIAQVAGSQQSYTDITAPSGVNYYAVSFTPASSESSAKSTHAASPNNEMRSNVISTKDAFVSIAATSISIGTIEKVAALTTNQTELHLTATVLPVSSTSSNISWSVTKGGNYTTLLPSGILSTAGGIDTVVVRATLQDGSGLYAEKTIPVYALTTAVDSIRCIAPKTMIAVGEKMQLSVLLGIYPAPIEWFQFTLPSNVSVDENGVLTGLAAGRAEIVAYAAASPYFENGDYPSASLWITVGSTTGIDDITMDDNSVKYYDLQGRRVEKLRKGNIYITNKHEKILVR